AWAAVVACLGTGFMACSAGERCAAGEVRACSGPMGCRGEQACAGDGSAWSVCGCGGFGGTGGGANESGGARKSPSTGAWSGCPGIGAACTPTGECCLGLGCKAGTHICCVEKWGRAQDQLACSSSEDCCDGEPCFDGKCCAPVGKPCNTNPDCCNSYWRCE